MAHGFSLLGVPIDCTGDPGKCSHAPAAMRALGITDAIGALRDYGDLDVRIASSLRDPDSGVIGASDVVAVTRAAKAAVERMLKNEERPVLVGGCCTVLMGAIAAARSVFGLVGLVYIDGHMDLYDGRTSPTGECADMPLSFAIGRGPSLLDTAMDGPAPVLGQDVSLVGYRDRELAARHGSLLPERLEPEIQQMDADAVKAAGSSRAANLVLNRQHEQAGRYWLHLDWDVLDQAAFSSADYLMAGGLSWDELLSLVAPLARDPAMIGLSLACYNPDNDPERSDGRRIVEFLGEVFGAP